MKEDLLWRYKKLERRYEPTFANDHIRRVFEAAMLQFKLNQEGVEIIYTDGFTVNTRHSSFRGWCVRGQKGYIRQPIESFNMSFVWAISTRRHYGLFGIKGANNSQIVKLYIQELLMERNKEKGIRSWPFVLVLDNASVHVSEISQSFYKSTKISVLTIPKYSPFLNPAEKLIGSIKRNIEKLQGQGRWVIYSTFYSIIGKLMSEVLLVHLMRHAKQTQ